MLSPRCKRRAVGRRCIELALPGWAIYMSASLGKPNSLSYHCVRCRSSKESRSDRIRLMFANESMQGFHIRNHLPALEFGEAAPRRHSVSKAAIRKQPEKFSCSGFFDAPGMEIRAIVPALHFAFGIIAMTGSTMFSIDLSPGCDRVRIIGQRIQTGAIFFRDFAQPTSIPSSGKRHSHQQQTSDDCGELHCRPRTREKNWSISYDNIKRNRKPLLLRFKPNVGEKRMDGPRGMSHDTRGAM